MYRKHCGPAKKNRCSYADPHAIKLAKGLSLARSVADKRPHRIAGKVVGGLP